MLWSGNASWTTQSRWPAAGSTTSWSGTSQVAITRAAWRSRRAAVSRSSATQVPVDCISASAWTASWMSTPGGVR